MKIKDILRATKRTMEPEEDGIYFVYDSWLRPKPRYVARIKVYHGPKGGLKRPVMADPPYKKWYWKNSNIWLTEEEHENEKIRSDSRG